MFEKCYDVFGFIFAMRIEKNLVLSLLILKLGNGIR